MALSPLRSYEIEYLKACRVSVNSFSESDAITQLCGQQIVLSELGRALLEPTVSQNERDRTWATVVSNARNNRSPWIIIAIGLAMPGLRGAVKHAVPYAPHFQDRIELESAAIAGFISAITDINIERSKICARLCNRAYVAARRCAIEISRYQRQLQSPIYESHPPSNQFGHIDLVLATAIQEDIITRVQATLIIDCCIDKQSITASAEAQGLDREKARIELKEAKNNVANWLMSGHPLETSQIYGYQ